MHRTYGYKDFSIEVDAEPIDGIPSGRVLSMPVGYVAVVHISWAYVLQQFSRCALVGAMAYHLLPKPKP